MSEQREIKEFRLGFDTKINPTYMIVEIPLEELSKDAKNGMALLIGKMEEAKAIAISALNQKMVNNKMNGLVKPRAPFNPSIV